MCDPTPPKPRQIVRCLGMLTHARSYLNPLTPSTLCRGSPRTRSTRIDPSGIPEGSIDSIDRGSLRGDPLGLDRGSPRARSTRSIGNPRGLDRLDRSGMPEGSIDSIDRGSLRARSTRSIEDPLGLDRLDRSGIRDFCNAPCRAKRFSPHLMCHHFFSAGGRRRPKNLTII